MSLTKRGHTAVEQRMQAKRREQQIHEINWEIYNKDFKILEKIHREEKKASKISELCFHSGRGAGKTETVAEFLMLESLKKPVKGLVVRDTKVSIRKSFQGMLEKKAYKFGIHSAFEFTQNEIRRLQFIKDEKVSDIMFLGSDINPQAFKSLTGIDWTIVEEATYMDELALELLVPSVTRAGTYYPEGRIIYMMNPDYEDDAVARRFILPSRKIKDPETNKVMKLPTDSKVIRTHFKRNKICPKRTKKQAAYDKKYKPKLYPHKWDGEFRSNSEEFVFEEGQDFHVKNIDEYLESDFLPYPFIGADWGEKNPSAAVEMYISKCGQFIYIYDEVYKPCGIDDLPGLLAGNDISGQNRWSNRFGSPGLGAIRAGYRIFGDPAPPQPNTFLRMRGFNIIGATKGPDSVPGGIAFLKGKVQIIHPKRCPNAARETRKYRYAKVRRANKEWEIIHDKYEKKNDHTMDARRYGLQPLIRQQRDVFADYGSYNPTMQNLDDVAILQNTDLGDEFGPQVYI